MKKILFILTFIFISFSLFSQKRIYKEVIYQNVFTDNINALTEVVLYDRTRVDVVTNDYAIEVDFANKWAESIGQSLYYSMVLNKKPGVLLIIEDYNKDQKYLDRLIKVAKEYNIEIWTIDLNFKIKKIKVQ